MFIQIRVRKCVYNKHNYATYIANNYAPSVPNKTLETKPDWKSAISEAKKCVGFSNSLWNLSCLKTDEMAGYITKRLQKPSNDNSTFKRANNFLSINKSGMLAGGLIVLLYSKTKKSNDDILQRSLAEITEMIKLSRLFHKAIININMKTDGKDDVQNWNKVSLLSGDFFLAKSFDEVAKLRNQKLSEIIALTCRDFAESEFIGERDIENRPLPSRHSENPEIEWTIRNTLSDGSLLATCCKGSMLLSKQSKNSQKQAYLFGKHFALANQASLELNIFKSPYEEGLFLLLIVIN